MGTTDRESTVSFLMEDVIGLDYSVLPVRAREVKLQPKWWAIRSTWSWRLTSTRRTWRPSMAARRPTRSPPIGHASMDARSGPGVRRLDHKYNVIFDVIFNLHSSEILQLP